MNFHHDGLPTDGASFEKVAQVKDSAVIQVTLTGEMMLHVESILSRARAADQDRVAAVLTALSAFVLMPEDDLKRVKHGVFWWRGYAGGRRPTPRGRPSCEVGPPSSLGSPSFVLPSARPRRSRARVSTESGAAKVPVGQMSRS